MRWLIGIVAGLAALAAVFWFGGIGRETWTSRFEIGVEVETPHGLKTGSSVIEMRTERDGGFLIWSEARGARTRIRGEAVFVDLGPDKDGKPQNLIALLATGSLGEDPNFGLMIARAVLGANSHQGTMGFGGFAAALQRLPAGKRFELKPPNTPTLVSFRDLADPTSARVVPADPREVSETDFAAVFGEGYGLKRIWIERSRKPVNFSIEQKLKHLFSEISKFDRLVMDPRSPKSYRPRIGHFRRNW